MWKLVLFNILILGIYITHTHGKDTCLEVVCQDSMNPCFCGLFVLCCYFLFYCFLCWFWLSFCFVFHSLRERGRERQELKEHKVGCMNRCEGCLGVWGDERIFQNILYKRYFLPRNFIHSDCGQKKVVLNFIFLLAKDVEILQNIS